MDNYSRFGCFLMAKPNWENKAKASILSSKKVKFVDIMGALAGINKKKELFHLPFKEDELEYWGPMNHTFCNSFLTMSNSFFEKFMDGMEMKTVKAVFSAFVELVQNVAEYNESHYQDNIPQTYVNVRVNDEVIFIKTANQLEKEDAEAMRLRLEKLQSYDQEQLNQQYKEALLKNRSLGLIMVHRIKDAEFDWEIQKKKDQFWLSIELKIKYGKA